MPSVQTVEDFIRRVESGAHVEAIAEFYSPSAQMRENQTAPRVGRDTLIAHERGVLARASRVESTCVRPYLISGPVVVVRWVFVFHWSNGSRTELEELAYQRWDGEKIAEEKFFYDPAQLRPTTAAEK